MAHIICKRVDCKHNQNENCLKSVITLAKQTVPEVNVGYVKCEQYEAEGVA